MGTWHSWHHWPDKATSYDGRLVRTGQSAVAVSLSDAEQYLRVDSGTESAVIERAVRAVQDQLEPPSGWLGRALTTASYRLTLPHFAYRIILPAPPLQSVTAFEYLDRDGNRQEVDSALYRIVETEPAEISLARNKQWPTDLDHTQPDAVSIEFDAGYGENPEDVPDVIRQWILYQVSMIYDIRNPVVLGTTAAETPFIRDMLETYRVKL